MSILIDSHTRVLVQGITGTQARRDVAHCRAYGTQIVCGVTPGRGGSEADGLPVYNTVAAALADHPIDATLVYAPPYAVRDAVLESLAAGIRLAVVLAENVPVHDAVAIRAAAERTGALVVGCDSSLASNCSSMPSDGSTPVTRAGAKRSITAWVAHPLPHPTSSTSS